MIIAGGLLFVQRTNLSALIQRELPMRMPRPLERLYLRAAILPGLVFVIVGLTLTIRGLVRLA
jgi:hypothetical protein